MTSIFDNNTVRRSAFTLVELLVVIAIIGLLAGMLIPAVNYARELGRRTQCINRQKEIGTAMISYALSKKGLPGHVEQRGNYKTGGYYPSPSTNTNMWRLYSWTAAILPELGEPKRYEIIQSDSPTTNQINQAKTRLEVLLCPSNFARSSTSDSPLSYVVNCGPARMNVLGDTLVDTEVKTFSLFRDRRATLVSSHGKVELDKIPDGTSNTVLLTENNQAWTWFDDWNDTAAGKFPLDEIDTSSSDTAKTRSTNIIGSLGFIWSNDTSGTNVAARLSKPNMDFKDSISAASINYARPSSSHPDVVVMLFGDGTVKAQNTDVALKPYLQLVCPDDSKVGIAIAKGGINYQ